MQKACYLVLANTNFAVLQIVWTRLDRDFRRVAGAEIQNASIPCSVPCSVPDSPFQQERPFLAEKPLSSYLDGVFAERNIRLNLQSIKIMEYTLRLLA